MDHDTPKSKNLRYHFHQFIQRNKSQSINKCFSINWNFDWNSRDATLMDYFEIMVTFGYVSGPNLVAIIMLGIEGTKACMLWLVCTLRARPREPMRPQTHCKQPVADWLMTPSSGVTVEIPVLASWTIGEYCGFTQNETIFSFFFKSYLGMRTGCWYDIIFVG